MRQEQALLECRGVCKSFSGNKVLQNIDLTINKGEVHALLGQNGAGKSTLVKIITGVYTLDSGELVYDGQAVSIRSPQDAERLGIAIIHQDQQMVPYFDVTRNAFLGVELRGRGGLLDFQRMRALVSEKLEVIGADFTADRQVSSLTVGQREQVAIAAALLQDPRLLILDEPTASLSSKEIERLFEIIGRLRDSGVAIVYISHHLDEVFRITDSITVLRDSRNQGTLKTAEADRKGIVKMMIGRELQEFYHKEAVDIGDVLLEVEDLRQGKLVDGVSLQLRCGEILGLAGLVGSGRTETVLSVYGAQKSSAGTMRIRGRAYRPRSPLDARREGIAFIPEDRRNEGIVANMDIVKNLSLADTGKWARRGIIRRALERAGGQAIVDALGVVCTGLDQPISELSGGNQQKVVIGRWMVGDAKIFIFDQPTTGVDIGAKAEIYRQMMQLAAKGCGIIFISSENEELLGVCDRIAVMCKGRVVKEFSAADTSEQELLYWSAGADEEGGTAG